LITINNILFLFLWIDKTFIYKFDCIYNLPTYIVDTYLNKTKKIHLKSNYYLLIQINIFLKYDLYFCKTIVTNYKLSGLNNKYLHIVMCLISGRYYFNHMEHHPYLIPVLSEQHLM